MKSFDELCDFTIYLFVFHLTDIKMITYAVKVSLCYAVIYCGMCVSS